MTGNTIWRIAEGRAEPLIHAHSHQLVRGNDGAIYGTNPEPTGTTASVWRLDAAGHFSYVLSPASGLSLGLQSFFITADGTIYSVNRYDHKRPTIVLMRRDPGGRIVAVAGATKGFADGVGSMARFAGIDGMSQSSDGDILLADGAYLRRFRPTGHVSTVTSRLTDERWGQDLLGISSVRASTVHVADHAGRRVLRVSLATGETRVIDRSAFLWAPAGVEVTDQAVHVLEHLRPPLSVFGDLQIGPYLRVRRVASDGSSTTMAVVWGRHSSKAGLAAAAACFVVAMWARTRMGKWNWGQASGC